MNKYKISPCDIRENRINPRDKKSIKLVSLILNKYKLNQPIIKAQPQTKV